MVGDTLHGSYGRKWQDNRQRLDETLEETDHDLELAQRCVVVVEARQKEDFFSRNHIARIGKSTDFNIICSVGKFGPLGGMKGKSIWIFFGHALGEGFAGFGGDDLVANGLSFPAQLVVHYLSSSSIGIIIFIGTFHGPFILRCLECTSRYGWQGLLRGRGRCCLVGIDEDKGICRRAKEQSMEKEESY